MELRYCCAVYHKSQPLGFWILSSDGVETIFHYRCGCDLMPDGLAIYAMSKVTVGATDAVGVLQ